MTSIAVVTSAWGGYGRFLGEWVAAVAAQSRRPDEVVIVDAGLDDPDAPARALAGSGLAASVVTTDRRGMGARRNVAVAEVSAEWVMHVDADDMMFPHALAEVESLADDADVVSIGAVRDGRVMMWPNVSREWILAGRQGALSGSAFRRDLWERAPFLESSDWIDSALWVGFAHLGARFVSTSRPGFVYRAHRDSHSAMIPPADKRAAREQHLRLCGAWAPE